MTDALVLVFLLAAALSTGLYVVFARANRRLNADIAFMRAIPAGLETTVENDNEVDR